MAGIFDTFSEDTLKKKYRVGLGTSYRPKTTPAFSPESIAQSLIFAGIGAPLGASGKAASMSSFGGGSGTGGGQVPIRNAFIDFQPNNPSDEGFSNRGAFEQIRFRDIPDKFNLSGFNYDAFNKGSGGESEGVPHPQFAPQFSRMIPGGIGSSKGNLNVRPPAETGFDTPAGETGLSMRQFFTQDNLARFGNRLFKDTGQGAPGPRYFPTSEEGMYSALAEMASQGWTDLPLASMGENPLQGWHNEELAKYGMIRKGGNQIPGTYRATV